MEKRLFHGTDSRFRFAAKTDSVGLMPDAFPMLGLPFCMVSAGKRERARTTPQSTFSRAGIKTTVETSKLESAHEQSRVVLSAKPSPLNHRQGIHRGGGFRKTKQGRLRKGPVARSF